MIKLKAGDIVEIEYDTFMIIRYGGPNGFRLSRFHKCETFGCTNPALDHTTSAGTATSVRVCAACAEAM